VRPLEEFAGQDLEWVQPTRLRRAWDLRSGAETVAMLRWQQTFGSLALGEAANGRWYFKRHGFIPPRITARAERSARDPVTLQLGWLGKGELQTPDGRRFRWTPIGLLYRRWTMSTDAGSVVLRYHTHIELLRKGATLRVERTSVSIAHLSLLAILGWYTIVRLTDEAASHAG
jgi:hypothetical protein